MTEKIRICCDNKLYIKGLAFEQTAFEPLCELEKLIPEDAYSYRVDNGARLFAVPARIGKDRHPFPLLCEAARYIDGAWIVGTDTEKNRYFTPIFTNDEENS
ncbi:MAG: hypothetical protein IJN39_00925 [Clostridia bacterium]|nr:hypothetical protein [Clostridia bacterium]